MKILLTKKAIVIYIAICVVITYVWDFVFKLRLPFLTNIVVGLLTIFGGFFLALWLIEKERLKKELERKKRILSALKIFKNSLLTWLFEYACTLSGDYKLFEESERIANNDYRNYKNYIPQLEDIFGIGVFDKSGERLRGTDTFNQKEFLKFPLGTQSLYQFLHYGLRMLEPVENRIKEFPTLLEEVNPEIATVVHLSQLIRSRVTALQEWENKYGEGADYNIDGSVTKGLEQKANLRKVGHRALDIAIAIDTNIKEFEAEL